MDKGKKVRLVKKAMYRWVEKFWGKDVRSIRKDAGYAKLGKLMIFYFNSILESES